ncbi:MAG: hypothetical protein ACW98U_11055 [Candidatus Thorarchaeota archaeon]|jgi:hypothetical protein
MIQELWFDILGGILSHYFIEILFGGFFLLIFSAVIYHFVNTPKRTFSPPRRSYNNDFEMTLNREFHNVGSDRKEE